MSSALEEGVSQAELARVLGVSQQRIAGDREALEAAAQEAPAPGPVKPLGAGARLQSHRHTEVRGMNMAEILQPLGRVPEVVWAAIAGAALTVLGVCLQSVFETRRLRRQLEHDAEQRKRDRDLELRRSLYLEAADSAIRTQRALSAVCNIAKPLAALDSLADPMDFAGLTKAHLVASMATIKALDDAMVAFLEQFQTLFELRLEVEMSQSEVDLATRTLGELKAQREGILALLGAERTGVGFSTTAAEAWPDRLADYALDLKAIQAKEAEASARLAVSQQAVGDGQRELLLRSVQASARYFANYVKVNVSLRRDLDQEEGFDSAEYERTEAETMQRVVASWVQFAARLTADETPLRAETQSAR